MEGHAILVLMTKNYPCHFISTLKLLTDIAPTPSIVSLQDGILCILVADVFTQHHSLYYMLKYIALNPPLPHLMLYDPIQAADQLS